MVFLARDADEQHREEHQESDPHDAVDERLNGGRHAKDAHPSPFPSGWLGTLLTGSSCVGCSLFAMPSR